MTMFNSPKRKRWLKLHFVNILSQSLTLQCKFGAQGYLVVLILVKSPNRMAVHYNLLCIACLSLTFSARGRVSRMLGGEPVSDRVHVHAP